MKNDFFSNPFRQIILSLFIILCSLLLFTALSLILVSVLFPHLPFNLLNPEISLKTPVDIAGLKFMQLVQAFSVFILAPLIIAWILGGKKTFTFLGMEKLPVFRAILLSVAIILVSIPLVNALGVVNSWLQLPQSLSFIEQWMTQTEKTANDIVLAFLQPGNIYAVISNFLIMAIIPAFGEEMLFRGIFQKIFIQWTKNIFWGIFITSLLFSALHLQFFTFLPRLALGFLLGYLFVITKSLWVPIIVHLINNSLAICIAMFSGMPLNESYYDKVGTTHDTWIYIVLSVMGVSVLLFLLHQVMQMQCKTTVQPDNSHS